MILIHNIIDLGDYRLKLNAARVNAGYKQDEVCKILKISKTTLVNLENYTKPITLDLLDKMCELYAVPDRDLIFFP